MTVSTKAIRSCNTDFLPRELREAPRWGGWHADAQGKKVPDQETNQLKKWGKLAKVKSPRKAFVFAPDDNWAGLDVDWKHSITGEPSIEQRVLITGAYVRGMYVEQSPSKLGVHIWARINKSKWPRDSSGKLRSFNVKFDDGTGIELYPCGGGARYFTMTGDADRPFVGELPDATEYLLHVLQQYKPERATPPKTNGHDHEADPQMVELALSSCDPDCSYADWLMIGMALQDWGDAFELWDAWSAKSVKEKYPGREALRDKWATFTANNGVTIASLFSHAREHGFDFKPDAAKEFSKVTAAPVPTRSASAKYETISIGDLLTAPIVPVEYLIAKYLPLEPGTAFVAARPKAGKTQLLQAIASAMNFQQAPQFLGQELAVVRMLYIDLEMSKGQVTRRLQKMHGWIGKDVERCEPPRQMCDFAFKTDHAAAGIKQLDEHLAANPDIRVVIIDTVQKFRGLPGNKNAYAEDYQFTGALADLAKRRRVLIVFVHHTKKGASVADAGLDALSGTYGLAATADTLWLLEQLKGVGPGQYLLDVQGREVGRMFIQIMCDYELFGWQFVREVDDPMLLINQRAKPNATLQESIVDYMRNVGCPVVARRNVAGRVGKTTDDSAFSRAVSRLIELGTVIDLGDHWLVLDERKDEDSVQLFQ